jgi:hypothetical protein
MIQFSAYEHKHEPKGTQWVVGIMSIASILAITSFVLGSWTFSLVILAAALAIITISKEERQWCDFAFGSHGISIKHHTLPYNHTLAFWIDTHEDEPILILETTHTFHQSLIIPLPSEQVSPDEIEELLLSHNIGKRPLKEPFSYQLFEYFGY